MATFTPNSSLLPGASPESDWAYLLGSVPWSGHIVFTKESLIEFLKTKHIEVSSSFKELQQLPKYATVGSFDRDPRSASSGDSGASSTTQAQAKSTELRPTLQPLPGVVDASGQPYRPKYKVTEPMGGGSAAVSALFAPLEEDQNSSNGVGERAPRRAPAPPTAAAATAAPEVVPARREAAVVEVPGASSEAGRAEIGQYGRDGSYRPTTRVTMPGGTGGTSSITLG